VKYFLAKRVVLVGKVASDAACGRDIFAINWGST
jgi:hypothetical protein